MMTRALDSILPALASMRIRIAWAVVLVLTIALYFPGLGGSYEFDDFPNIVDNDALHVTTSDASAWLAALWASPASDLQRPLASLSFALNYFFTGPDPWPMKITNLAIHLVNGCLLFVLLRRILSARRTTTRDERSDRDGWIALAIAAIWLVHPINLTAVLFVVQRMESLAQCFVLLGLLCYVDARVRQRRNERGAVFRLWIAFPLCLVLGVATKESAALLPVYALALELTVFANAQTRRNELIAFYATFLVVPGLVGLAWMLPHVVAPEAYAARPFTLIERLLTEPRVLFDYVAWTLLPLPGFFSFFRDDFNFSTGLLSPWTTLPAILGVLAAIVAALALRRRAPLISLGVLWFFAAHALTSNVFPLELVFEHRNYFASIGLLLAVVPPLFAWRFAGVAIVSALGALCALSLALRAREWSDPITLAVSEAARHPESPRATYELGRTYVLLGGYRADSPNTAHAFTALEAAMRAPRSSILPEAALIMLASRTGRPLEPEWWASMIAKLDRRAPTVEDSTAIKSLTLCQREGRCVLDDEHMLQTYFASLKNGAPDAGVLYSYAIFAFNRLHDPKLALDLARDAAASRDPQYEINLANFLIDLDRLDEARTEIDRLRARDRLGNLTQAIAKLEQKLTDATARPPTPPSG